jgi:hypothetical protein
MKSAGLVTAKTSIAFHSWTIDTGPLVESNLEIWDEIAAALGKGKVEVAAAALRHHLETFPATSPTSSAPLPRSAQTAITNSENSFLASWRV